MKISGILFDLDGTLIDTSCLDQLREARQWKECVKKFNQTTVFPGIMTALNDLSRCGMGIGIVTSSVSYYAASLLEYHSITYNTLIAYHDVKNKKPHPEPYLRAAAKLNIDLHQLIGVGDKLEDALSLNAANIESYGAGWNKRLEGTDRDWRSILTAPTDILKLIT